MTSASASPLNNGNGYTYPKMPIDLPKAAYLPDSATKPPYKMTQNSPNKTLPDPVIKALIKRIQNSYDEDISLERLIANTFCPGQKSAVVADIAESLTRIKDPQTGRSFLDQKTFKEESEKSLTINGLCIMKLSAPIQNALIAFQITYMELATIDASLGYLGPFECNRILTIDIGIMLTQLNKPKTVEKYLDATEFYNMEKQKKIDMGKGSPNRICEAFKAFLKDHPGEVKDFLRSHPEDVGAEESPHDIITFYHILEKQWKK
jgi:hypothetical protein